MNGQENQNKLLESALAYAALGWPVIPLHTPTNGKCSCRKQACGDQSGKHPRRHKVWLRSFKDAATCDGLIELQWEQWPGANIGILTGSQSGLLVLDIDPRNGGYESLADLNKRYGEIPRGPRAHTGGGGLHIYTRHPAGTIKSATGVWPGIDVIADGAYVVAPPSLHASGHQYQWEDEKCLQMLRPPIYRLFRPR
jgi:hypothetical protein